MAEVSITDAVRHDPRVLDLLLSRTRGSIAGIIEGDELRGLGYEVPSDHIYHLRAWPFETHYSGQLEDFRAEVAAGYSRRPVIYTNDMTKSDWIIIGGALAIITLGIGLEVAAATGPAAAGTATATPAATTAAVAGPTAASKAISAIVAGTGAASTILTRPPSPLSPAPQPIAPPPPAGFGGLFTPQTLILAGAGILVIFLLKK